MENRKELIQKFRSRASGGNSLSRTFLLAYAFLRGASYAKLEAVINEDRFPREPNWDKLKCGMFGFLHYLAYGAAYHICDMAGDVNAASITSEMRNALREEIYQWMLVKYQEKEAEKAEENAA
jgi:hypothetical protein